MDFMLGRRLRELPGPILVTGHTGFKGAWLTFLLDHLGIDSVGYSLAPTADSLYARANREGAIPEAFADIRDFDQVRAFLAKHRPSAIIHMAAQPLVLESYKSPRETFDTNVMGTVNILDAAFETNHVEAIVAVTTDKVYRNDNSGRAFVETDALAGKDPYSASKVGTESAVAAWQQIAKVSGGPKVVSVRAGNVIGGGDWAENRLIPDLVRGFASGQQVQIRNPESTRPWQHVLDPLSGYLMALEAVLNGKNIPALNFGPSADSLTVREVVDIATGTWPNGESVPVSYEDGNGHVEAKSLQLDSTLARSSLGWKDSWNQKEAVMATVRWWDNVLNNATPALEESQIDIAHLLQRISG
ncbi:MAG TPA: CDP-glucose 4,6-dehydratase [Candidatus Nanopelagicaceae bacterium]